MHFQEGNDVLVEGAVVVELIRQIENYVRVEALELLTQQVEIIKNCEMIRNMTKLRERGHHVRFGLSIFGLEVLAQILVQRRGRQRVEQSKDFKLLLHSYYFVRLNFPVKR